MKKLLLLNPPGTKKYMRDYYCSRVSKAKYFYHPMDLVYLSGWLSPYFELSVIDAIAEQITPQETFERISKINPDAVVFLISAPSYYEDIDFFTKLKQKLPNALFVGGGDIYRELKGNAFKEQPWLDAIYLDFSTDNVVKFFNGPKGKKIENIIYKYGKKVIDGGEVRTWGKTDMPVPRWELFPLKNYSFPFSRHKMVATILTDYGCAYNCMFCPMSTIGFKLRNTETVVQELKLLQSLGIRDLFIKDQTFGVNKNRTYELFDAMESAGLKFGWTCFSRVDVVNEELISRMKQAGCNTIMFGIESANESTLKEYNKNTKVEQMLNAVKICRKYKIQVVGTFIIGLPGESEEQIMNTIEFSTKLGLDFASFNIATPRFGSPIREKGIKENLVDIEERRLDSAKSMPVWKNRDISNEEIFKLQRKAIKHFYLRPAYLMKRLFNVRTPYEFTRNFEEAFSLLAK